jgi:glycosyltransferase involved in cell wall biosynthesis
MHFIGKRGRGDFAGFLWRLIRVLRELRPGVVYSFLDVPNILAAVFAPLIGRPRLVWSVRAAGMDMARYDWLSRLAARLEARCSRLAEIVVANSHAGAAWAADRGFPALRLCVIENGIDTRHFLYDASKGAALRASLDVAPDEKLIGLVGRLDVMKDHRGFLRAAALVCAQRSGIRFACVGEGPADYLNELKSFAAQQGIGDRVHWLGVRPDMPAVYSALDVLCSSSAFGEGFSNVIGEAMACGTPCVVTDVGDSARIVAELGEAVAPGDPMALAQALLRMLDRCEAEQDLPVRVRQRVESEFSLQSMVVRTDRILFPFSLGA